jgi:predicted alpha/beta superfamily hydrolase
MTEAQQSHTFEEFELPSRSLGMPRRITVWLPPGRIHRSDRYPVLYLNDGQNLFDPRRAFGGVTWQVAETATRLIALGLLPPLVIVGIDHGGMRRAREFLPVPDTRNPYARRPLGRQYGEFVLRELMPIIERTFPVARGASATGFGGSSYGAVAALFTTLEHPGVFGRLLLESPSLYVGRGYLLRRAKEARRWPARIYLGVGTAETRRQEWNDETVANVRRLEGTLRGRGFGPRRLKVVVQEGATHSEHAWAARLPEALAFLFGQ